MAGELIEWCDNLRVTSYEFEIFYASCEFYLFYELRVTIDELWVTFYELKIKITSCNLWLYFILRRNLQNTQRIAKIYCLFT